MTIKYHSHIRDDGKYEALQDKGISKDRAALFGWQNLKYAEEW